MPNTSGKQSKGTIDRGRLARIGKFAALLVVLVAINLAVWSSLTARSTATATATSTAADASKSDISLDPNTRAILFVPKSGEWVLTTFSRAKPDSEFAFNNQLYTVVDSGKARLIPGVDAAKLAEADLPADSTSRRPVRGDAVQVLDEDMRFVKHAPLSAVEPGTTIRFQGKVYEVNADRNLTDTGRLFSAATTPLRRIQITSSSWRHIVDRHTVGGSMNAGKSTFSQGEDISGLIKGAELLAPAKQARGNMQRVFDAGRTIGIDRSTGKQTSVYSVITTESGKLVTAFPGLP